MVGTGISRAISISNTRNSTARMKNRKENGIRAELWGSNPHSNGVAFSKLIALFLFSTRVAMIIKIGKIAAVIMAMVRIIIFLGIEIPVNEVKIHCCCKLPEMISIDVGGEAHMFNVIKVIRSSGATSEV